MTEGLQINLSMAGVQQTLGGISQLQNALGGISQRLSGLSTLGKLGIAGALAGPVLSSLKNAPDQIRAAQTLWKQWDDQIKSSTSITDWILSPYVVARAVGKKMADDFFGVTAVNNLKAANELRNEELDIAKQLAQLGNAQAQAQHEIAERVMSLGPGYSLLRKMQEESFQAEKKFLNLQEANARKRGAQAKTQIEALKVEQELKEIEAKRELLRIQDHAETEQSRNAEKRETNNRANEALEVQTRIEERLLKIKQDQFDVDRAMVQANFRLTEIEKREKTLALLIQERDVIKSQIELLQKRQDALDPADPDNRIARELLQGRIDQTSRRGLDVNQQIVGIEGQADPASFAQQFESTLNQLRDAWGTWATQAATSFKNVFESAISSISSGISGLILGTQTWAQALANIGNQILTSIVNAIVQMGVRWIATKILMATVGKAIAAASVAATIPLAAAQSAVWATPATLATIASAGGAAVAAPGFIKAANAATLALSAFAQGGYTGDGPVNSVAGIVHGREYVMPAPAVDRIGLANLDAMRSGAGIGGGSQNIAFFDDGSKLSDWARTQEGETVIVDVVRRNLHRFGQA